MCLQQKNFNDSEVTKGAFSASMLALRPEVWIQTFMKGVSLQPGGPTLYNDLAWFACKVLRIVCSASACEHSWSIEGWIHSKRRNRLAQPLVEKLVRAHTNLVLRRALDRGDNEDFPWYVELTIGEAAGDEDDV